MKNVLVPILFLLLAAIILLPVLSRAATTIPGGFRDAYSILWQVWWYGQAPYHGGETPFFTLQHGFPNGERYFTYQHVLFYLPTAVLARITGPVAATNIAILVSLWLIGLGGFLLFR